MSRLTDRSVYGMVDLLVLKTLSRGGEMHGLSIIDEMPRTATGKIQKFELRKQAKDMG